MIVLTVGNASAWFGIFEIKDETFFDGDWGVADAHGVPSSHAYTNDANIRGKIDIIGFRNMSVVNGTRYVNGIPKSFAIVKRSAWYELPVDAVFVSFKSIYHIYDTLHEDGVTTTTALQITTFKWGKWVCEVNEDGSEDCVFYERVEYLTITDVVESPYIFNNNIDNYTIVITSYNNSVTPYTLIYVPYRLNIVKETVEYKNNNIQCHNKTGWVTTNSKGTEHVRFLNKTLRVEDPTYTITRRSEYYVINEAPLDWKLLNISVQTPYVLHDDLAWDVTVVHSKPSDYISWKLMVVFVFVLVVFLVAGYYAVNAGRM